MPVDERRRSAPRVLILGCGALARELNQIVERNQLAGYQIECLPAQLHNTPEQIPAAVEQRLRRAAERYDRVFVAYADCGTSGELDAVLARYGAQRVPGAHCYEFYAGSDSFRELHQEEPGTLYLTDYLLRHFDRLIWEGLGLDRHPELLADYFRHYRRVVHLAQVDDPDLERRAGEAADRLGLAIERRMVGYGTLEPAVVEVGLPKPRLATR